MVRKIKWQGSTVLVVGADGVVLIFAPSPFVYFFFLSPSWRWLDIKCNTVSKGRETENNQPLHATLILKCKKKNNKKKNKSSNTNGNDF